MTASERTEIHIAAAMLRKHAAALKSCAAVRGKWPADAKGDRLVYLSEMSVARDLERIARKY